MSEPALTALSRADLRVEHHHGPAQELHGLAPPIDSVLTVGVMQVDRPAVVLGSTQDRGTADPQRAAGLGFEIVSRRSGGGAVLLVPDEHLWVDFWVPRSHERFDDDVVSAAFWVGELWARAAEDVLALPATVHRAGHLPGRYGATVCFAGIGPGEVSVEGRKLVGISQRRTRGWARIQTLAHQRWQPALLAELLGIQRAPDDALAVELQDTVALAPREALLAALGKQLTH